jgi:uncharacterized protein
MKTLGFVLVLGALWSAAALGASDVRSVEVMKGINARGESERQQSRLQFTLTPRSGAAQVREATAYRTTDANMRRLAIRFEAPSAIRGSAFLAWDARDATVADDQWLYLPALRRARRVPGRDRGSYFLGTDLTYDDIRSFGRIEVAEYRLSAPRAVPGQPDQLDIAGEPATPELRKELGYGRLRWRVNTRAWRVLRSEHWDLQDAPLKNVEYLDPEQIEGDWIPTRIRVENLKTGHRTELKFTEITATPDFDPALLTPSGLERGG